MPLNEHGFAIIDLPPIDHDMRESFSNLTLDPYMGGGNRFRRFAQYKMIHKNGQWEFERLPLRPYVTFSKYNKVAGGIKRYYDPIEQDFTGHIRAGADAIPMDTDDTWQLNVHQYRIIVNQELQGVIVPEGVHQDGHEHVMIAVFQRHGITGAEMSLRPADDVDTPFFTGTLQEGQAVVFDDRAMFHYVTEIEPAGESGHRDTVVVAFSRWAEKWYGDDFDKEAINEGSTVM